MLSPTLVLVLSFGYLLLLFAVAGWADRRAAAGRSVIGKCLGLCLVDRRLLHGPGPTSDRWAVPPPAGVWFLPIYLGPTLAMLVAWVVLRKMVRTARAQHVTSIADFIASRYGKSPALAGLVSLITVVGIVPYIALQLKAVASAYQVLTVPLATAVPAPGPWWSDGTFYVALALAGFTMVFGTRHLDATERHEGMVAAIAFESLVKLVAFPGRGRSRHLVAVRRACRPVLHARWPTPPWRRSCGWSRGSVSPSRSGSR
jgi:hypothetical protein